MTREEAIFAEVLGKCSEAEEAAYLDLACAGDPVLRREVEALLIAHRSPKGILESPPAPPDLTSLMSASNHGVGSSVGPYKLLEQIGGGGMGVVYMAEQSRPVRRMVALKIIKPGMDSRQVIARFEAERQALTMMDHPNIARVLDAGTTDTGSPYFVMELVKGVPITDYCDQAQLNTRERLELFIPVCQAVQHAHQKGIIHRDLKPSNILVTLHDDKPVPKVIDFGIAKATGQSLTDKTLFTHFAQMMGTPLYMSPEQAQISGLDVDTRSDVYSLGVLLYELLTGTTPFVKQRLLEAAYDEMRRIIREEEPPKPSTRLSTLGDKLNALAAHRKTDPRKLDHLIRGELDWIVMKAMEKDRARRYATPAELSQDVHRYITDEPVAACPPSAFYKFRKFSRRHKGKLVTGALLGLALLVTMAAIGWSVRDRQTRELLVEQAVGHAMGEAEAFHSQGLLREALAAAKRAEAALSGGSHDPALATGVKAMLDDLQFEHSLEKIRDQTGEALWGEYDFHHVSRTYAATFREAGIDLDVLSVEEAASRIKAHPRIAIALAQDLDAYAHALGRGTEFADTRKLHAIATAVDDDPWRKRVRETLGREDTKTLRELAESADLLHQPPTTIVLLVQSLKYLGQVGHAEELLRKEQREHPGDFWVNHEMAKVLQRQGDREYLAFDRVALALRPDNGVALSYLYAALRDAGEDDEAMDIWRRAVRLRPDDEALQRAMGKRLRLEGKLDAANAAALRAVEINRKNVEREPTNGTAYMQLGRSLLEAGDALHDPRLHAEAVAALRRADELEALSAFDDVNLAFALSQSGLVDEAVARARKAVDLNPKSPDAHRNLALLLVNQGELLKAEHEIREVIRLKPDAAISYSDLGMILSMLGKNLTEAEAACQQAISISEKLVTRFPSKYKDQIDLGSSFGILGKLACQRGKWERGLELYAKAVAILESVPAQDPDAARGLQDLTSILGWRINQLSVLKRYPEVIKDCDKALALQKPATFEGYFRLRIAMPAGFESYFRLTRAVALARTGDYVRPIAEAEKTLQEEQDPENLYNLACLYSVASGKITSDEKLKDRYSTQALALLGRALATGFFAHAKDIAILNEDSDLEPLRPREDFKKFLASVTRQVQEKALQQSREAATRKSATTVPAK